MVPRTRYARSGELSIAYQVTGDGPFDLVFVPGFVNHVELAWEERRLADLLGRLGSFARLIRYDKREQGLSDRVGRPPTLEESMQDLSAVLAAAGCERVALFGISEGGPMCELFAASHPERTRSLVLYGSYARLMRAPDYTFGVSERALDRLLADVMADWGGPAGIELWAPSLAHDARFRDWWARFLRSGSSPGGVTRLLQLYREIDTRAVLGAIRVPTLVLHRRDDRMITLAHGRYLAAEIPQARLVELAGADHLAWAGDTGALLDEVEEFLTGTRPERGPERVLATVLFTDIVGSTERAAVLGDARWRELLASHDERARSQIERHRGRLVKTTGDGVLASFDGPARAIRCALALRADLRALGVDIRAGLHTGEVEVLNGDLGGSRRPPRRPCRGGRRTRRGARLEHRQGPRRRLRHRVRRTRRAPPPRRARRVAPIRSRDLRARAELARARDGRAAVDLYRRRWAATPRDSGHGGHGGPAGPSAGAASPDDARLRVVVGYA